MIKWSPCSPSTLMIRVRILLNPKTFIVQKLLEKNKNKLKRGRECSFMEVDISWMDLFLIATSCELKTSVYWGAPILISIIWFSVTLVEPGCTKIVWNGCGWRYSRPVWQKTDLFLLKMDKNGKILLKLGYTASFFVVGWAISRCLSTTPHLINRASLCLSMLHKMLGNFKTDGRIWTKFSEITRLFAV